MSENLQAYYNRLETEHRLLYRFFQEQSQQVRKLKTDLEEVRKDSARWKRAAETLYSAYTPDGHTKGHDCFATGPSTGDAINDLIACPGCAAQAAIDNARGNGGAS